MNEANRLAGLYLNPALPLAEKNRDKRQENRERKRAAPALLQSAQNNSPHATRGFARHADI
jgi:hypothetical protein